MLYVADNSGVRVVRMIGVLGKGNSRIARCGDLISAAALKTTPRSKIRPGQVVRGVVVNTCYPTYDYSNGVYTLFNQNRIVLVNDSGECISTKIFGAISKMCNNKKIMRLAERVL